MGFLCLEAFIEDLQVMPLPYACYATGRDEDAYLSEFITDPLLAKSRILKSKLYNGLLL
jgi:hypothetical protein